ncbi:hypothetical protein FOA43_003233 [Brettanomyces nanus]|uniref:Amidase domain-containing protein n=1 Tax=Eeniella nana TaxID=13502 RepID=A0A875RQ41_EENNA|nr:uncharacterized protein FOA43_003233 [Brettanomyces nanus]QPG75850.1 hypothetical protein FOA43_003233 [Brettanomyces nanus]
MQYYVSSEELPTVDQLNDVSKFLDTTDLISEENRYLTEIPVSKLRNLYFSGETNVERIALAYFHRVALAQQLVNCITEVRFEEALDEAKKQDCYFRKTGDLCGPLHGVIISLKDNIRVTGLSTSMGFAALAEQLEEHDSVIVKLLKDLGGIIICKSNTSSGMMYSETTNELWGRTLNPYNRKYLNNGGSSGGEGAIAALGGSCFGVGSDIGGSVRHPAGLNNVYSIKPSFGRIPCFGTASGQQGQESVRTVYGLLSHHLENVQYGFKAIVDSQPYRLYDCSCIPLKYKPYHIAERKLIVGFLDQDGLTSATPPVLRGLGIVKKAVKDAGHYTIDWPATYLKEIREAIYPFYEANGFKGILKIIEKTNEPVDKMLSKWFPKARDMPVSELWQLQSKRTTLAQQYLDLWNTHCDHGRIDAIIMPVSPFPACLKDGVVPLPCTAIWNGLDYSASTFPVTRCEISVDGPILKTQYVSELDKKVHQTYSDNLTKFEGGPVALQVVCNRLEEEKCLELTKYISSLLR